MEEGRSPRNSRVLYDRKNSAISKMKPEHLPADLFQPGKARLLHMTGITPAIGEDAALTVLHALKLAKQAGWLVSFDVNYRAGLWSPEQCRTALEAILPQVDILFSPLGDATRVFNTPDDANAALKHFHAAYPQAIIAMTIGKDGATACDRDGNLYRHPAFPAEQVDRLGGGDAFSAGFLYGYLTTSNIATALRWGTAVAALKYTIPGDFPLIDYDDALKLVEGSGDSSTISR
jgi:2-dehydro-3-deoxygluconokinase